MSSNKSTGSASSASAMASANTNVGHVRNVCGNFPLRPGFFRCLPLPVDKRQQLYRTARKNADQLIKQVYNDQWRYVPPEKNGVLLRKDTSNMQSSFRLVRLGTVLRCQEHEANQILLNTNTESLRGFLRKCFGKNYIDSMLLHEIIVPERGTTTSNSNNNNNNQTQELKTRSESASDFASTPTERPSLRLKSLTSDSGPIVERLRAMDKLREEAAAAAAAARDSNNSEHNASSANIKNPLVDCGSVDDGASTSALASPAVIAHVDSVSPRSSSSTNTSKDEPPQFEEFLTIKWGVFDTSVSGKSDLCVVDYISSAFVPVSEDKELVNLWCMTSVDGTSVGCLELKETHSVVRQTLSKLGVFWRKISNDETEITLCGSFPSKHAKFAGKVFLDCLGRLQSVVEDLRLSNQLYMQRSNWVEDSERSSCHLCMRNFHALRRKHHCRKCGEVVCHDCSLVENVDLPVIGYSKLRLCKVCLVRAKSTPLKKSDKSNVFDMTEHARSLSTMGKTSSSSASNWPNRSTMIHSSIDENNCTDSFDRDNNSLGNRSSSSMFSSGDEASFNAGCDTYQVVTSGRATVRAQRPQHGNNNNNDLDEEEAAAVIEELFDSRKLTERFSAMEQTKASSTNMFDLLCELACQTLSCPIACVCIQESAGGEAFRSVAGLDDPSLDTEVSVFVEKIMGSSPSIILDSRCDKHVQSLFRSALPSIRFFAGSPIYSRAGKRLGYVCVADTSKRDTLGASCAFTMERLATLAVTTLERNGALTGNLNLHAASSPSVTPSVAAVTAPNSRKNNLTPVMGSPQEYHEVLYDDSYNNRMPVRVGSSHNLPTRDPYANRYYEAQERMRKLLLKSYHTQQQLAAGSGGVNGSGCGVPPPPM